MADWDQEKLEAVVQQKHSGQTTKPTDIVRINHLVLLLCAVD